MLLSRDVRFYQLSHRPHLLGASLVLLILFIQSYVIEATIFNSRVDLTYLLASLAVALVSIKVLQTMRISAFALTDVAIFLFTCSVLLSAFVNGSGYTFSVKVLLSSILPYFVARQYTMSSERIANIVGWSLLVVSVIFSAVLFLTFAHYNFGISERLRIGGANPIAAGEVLGLGAVTALVWGTGVRRWLVWGYIVAGMLCVMAQVLIVGSRGALFAVLFALAVVSVISRRAVHWGVMMFAMALIGAAVVVGSVQDIGVVGRLSPLEIVKDPSVVGNEEYIGRIGQWRESVTSFLEHPLLGVGPGKIYSHNIILEIAAGMGVIGVMCFAFIIVSIPWSRFVILARESLAVRVIVGLVVFTFAYRLSSFNLTMHKSLFVFLGLLIGVLRRECVRRYRVEKENGGVGL